jgi:hypothetical protein
VTCPEQYIMIENNIWFVPSQKKKKKIKGKNLKIESRKLNKKHALDWTTTLPSKTNISIGNHQNLLVSSQIFPLIQASSKYNSIDNIYIYIYIFTIDS